MTQSEEILRLDGLGKSFLGLRAVDQVSISVRRGELVGLIGPNGAGKTTLFNMIAGALEPSDGRVHFKGQDITRLSPDRIAKAGIARTYQNLRVFPDITVFDNVSVGAVGRFGVSLTKALFPFFYRQHNVRIAEATITALEHLNLAHTADLLAGNLAYGQKKMLEIARAIALAPDLLLLDEPAAGLNTSETDELAVLLRDLSSKGLTILLVEHDMPMVMRVCDRIVVLDSGQKIADDVPSKIRIDKAVRAAYLGDAE